MVYTLPHPGHHEALAPQTWSHVGTRPSPQGQCVGGTDGSCHLSDPGLVCSHRALELKPRALQCLFHGLDGTERILSHPSGSQRETAGALP